MTGDASYELMQLKKKREIGVWGMSMTSISLPELFVKLASYDLMGI